MDQAEDRSPDGRLLVRFDIEQGRMSHEIWTPTIVEVASGRTLLHIRQHSVDGRPQWQDGGFSLGLRHYLYPHLWLSLTADLDRGCFRFDGSEREEPITDLSDRVDEELRRQIAASQGSAQGERSRNIARDVGVVLLGLAVVAAAAWFVPG